MLNVKYQTEMNTSLAFSMPMFRKFVPERIRPFFYLAFAIIFQLTGGIYLGALADMRGEMSLLQEDIMMCGSAGFIGLVMPFPLLFRLKFRFHNKWMLTLCAAVIILCNMTAMYTEYLPVLWAACFLAGWCKLWATFECISNIQLWIAPGRDFFRFFPILYIVVLSCIEGSGILAELNCYYLTWEFAPVIVISLLIIVIILLQILTVNFRPGKPFPLFGIDWTGIVLWSLLLMELSFVFLYGEHYNWFEGTPIKYTAAAVLVTGFLCIGRMKHIRHPYLEIKSWKYENITPAIIIFMFACLITSSSKVLESAFSGQIIPRSPADSIRMHVCNITGIIAGSLFSLYCLRKLKISLGKLTIMGMASMTLYTIMMFFLISPDTAQYQLWIPAAIRQFGYTIIFITLTLYIQVQMPFQHFFQGLCIIGMARTVLGGAVGGAVYGYLMRWNMADSTSFLSSGIDPVSTYGMDTAGLYGDLMRNSMMFSIKNLFGLTAITAGIFIIIMLLFDSPVRRKYINMPAWSTVRKYIRNSLYR